MKRFPFALLSAATKRWALLRVIPFAFAMASLVAQTVEEWPLRPVDPNAAVAAPEEITFRTRALNDRGFNRVVRKVSIPTVTVYHPTQHAHRGAAILAIPGGAYDGIVIDREGHQLARYFQGKGITVVVLKYRLPQADTFAEGVPAPQQDALEALRFIRRHALEWQIDPHRVGVIGASAGGHLAGTAALFGDENDGSRPDFVGMLYPVVTFRKPLAHAISSERLLGPEPSLARIDEYSLERRVRPGLPPFFIVHAQDDKTVSIENSILLAAALKQVSVPCDLLTVATGGHGFSVGRGEESAHWKDQFIVWLDALP